MNKATLIIGCAMLFSGLALSIEFVQEYREARGWAYRFGADDRRRHLRKIRRLWLRTTAPFWVGGLVLLGVSFVIGG